MMRARGLDHRMTSSWGRLAITASGGCAAMVMGLVLSLAIGCPAADEEPAECTDPMPGLCDESTECGECGTCLMPGIIEIDADAECHCRPDVGACLQGTQDQPQVPYLMYHVDDGTVVWMSHKVAFEHPSWAYCSDGNGPPACSCDPNPFFDACE